MSNRTESELYDTLINDVLTHDTSVKGSYPFPNKSTTVFVDKKDLENFKKLYKITGGNQCIGYGEVALYWLYGGRLQPAGDTDLMKNSHKIDVKSYEGNKFFTLGKWKDNIKTRNIVNNLFACYNLMHEDFKSELYFTTSHIEDAIRANIKIHKELDSLYRKNSVYFGPPLLNTLKTLDGVVREFEKLSKKRERNFIDYTDENLNEIVKESIADLIYDLVHYKLFESPTGIGTNGYIINVVKKNESTTGEIQVHRVKGLSKQTDRLSKNFNVTSGEIKIRPDILDHV